MLLIAIFCKSPTSNRAVFVEFQITIQFSINIRYYYHCSMCECAMCSALMSVTDWDPAPAMRAPAPGPGHLVTGRQSPDTPRPRVPCPALETSEIIQCIQIIVVGNYYHFSSILSSLRKSLPSEPFALFLQNIGHLRTIFFLFLKIVSRKCQSLEEKGIKTTPMMQPHSFVHYRNSLYV